MMVISPKHKYNLLLSLVFIFVFTLTLSCANSKQAASENPDTTQPGASTSTLFPHSESWSEPTEHGAYTMNAYTSGTDSEIGVSCRECHGADLEGGDLEISCYQCHTIFPHRKNWLDTGSNYFHGVAALENGIEESCATECHGTDLTGGTTEISCYQCHTLYPHTIGNTNIDSYFPTETTPWSDYSVHGNFVLTTNAIEAGTCATNCHGTDLTGGLASTPCSDCHTTYPHTLYDNNWANNHTGFVNASGDASCASTDGCHTNKYQGPDTVVQSCTTTCH